MNKLEANLSLLAITFFAGIQYAFLKNLPAGISDFSFLTVTNLLGFLITLAVFSGELFRLNLKQVLHGALLAAELLAFNFFLLMGSRGLNASVISFLAAGYIVLLPLLMLLFKKKPGLYSILGVILTLSGLVLALGVNAGILNVYSLYMLAADLCFAIYMLTVEKITSESNPAILAMAQMLFGAIFGFTAWVIEVGIGGLSLPVSVDFWATTFVITFFLRGLYGVVQIYAQRYVSAINASLIFSVEIVFTLIASAFFPMLLGAKEEVITASKAIGCMLIILGALVADGALPTFIIKKVRHGI